MSTEKEFKEVLEMVGILVRQCIASTEGSAPTSSMNRAWWVLTDKLLTILTELEEAREDVALVDWLEQTKEHHGFCGTGYGEYRYYAGQCDGWGSVRKVINAARKGEA